METPLFAASATTSPGKELISTRERGLEDQGVMGEQQLSVCFSCGYKGH